MKEPPRTNLQCRGGERDEEIHRSTTETIDQSRKAIVSRDLSNPYGTTGSDKQSHVDDAICIDSSILSSTFIGFFYTMVKHCIYGLCRSDSRYPDKLAGAKFIPFVKPSQDLQKCLRWITLCGRPNAACKQSRSSRLTPQKITKHTYICSKHFYNGEGPSEEYPDPCDAITGEFKKARTTLANWHVRNSIDAVNLKDSSAQQCRSTADHDMEMTDDGHSVQSGTFVQTEETLYSSIEMLSYAAQIHKLQQENRTLKEKLNTPKKDQSCQTDPESATFSSDAIQKSPLPGLFKFYTGLEYVRFSLLLSFLFPNKETTNLHYDKNRKDIKKMPVAEQLFLVLCRLRNGLNVKDLAFRFNISSQSVSSIFSAVIQHMYVKLASLSFWPHRDRLILNMPDAYKTDFPTTMVMIDCTELKTEKPSSLLCQSQCYSDYKSSTTLKALVVCDSRGSVMFVSDLYSGSISDNDICQKCGFYDLLKDLKARGFLKDGDAVMADKGFRIKKELEELKLELNIPPLNSITQQMSAGDVATTRKIAAHRIHIERAINQIKCFKILKKRLPVSLFQIANDIWLVCAVLTNFQDTLVKKT